MMTNSRIDNPIRTLNDLTIRVEFPPSLYMKYNADPRLYNMARNNIKAIIFNGEALLEVKVSEV